jgi:Excalibur calcium-binding domain
MPHIVKSGSKRSPLLAVVLVAALGVFGYFIYQQANRPTVEPQSASPAESTAPQPQASAPKPTKKRLRQQAVSPVTESTTTPEPQVFAQYQCDGRTRCSQMTSCEEAKFFLQNCPGTKMDGDNDGIPCEQQWCGR